MVLEGDLYRLNNPLNENLFAEMLVAKDKSKAEITVMRPLCVTNGGRICIYPKGLETDSVYEVVEMGLARTGATLMRVGLNVDFPRGDFQTKTFTIKKI